MKKPLNEVFPRTDLQVGKLELQQAQCRTLRQPRLNKLVGPLHVIARWKEVPCVRFSILSAGPAQPGWLP
jgi:hypothetical protein